MRRLRFIYTGLWLCVLLTGISRADTFNLTDGRTISGDLLVSSANESGVQVRMGDGNYQRVSWASFSQDDLKKLAQDPKMAPFTQPLIVETSQEKAAKTQVDIKPVPRLERPSAHSVVGAMFSSSLGIFIILLLYAANIYAAFEISLFRRRPRGLVCGTAAVLPFIAPIVFLAMPSAEEVAVESATRTAADVQSYEVPPTPAEEEPAVNPMAGDVPASAHSSLKLHREESPSEGQPLPPTQVFQRGAYTFNRRFIETKFASFFGVVRGGADKNMVLLIKASRGEYVADRISRITANDMHVQVRKDEATQEILVPFGEIKEIHLKHKDA